MNMELVQVYYAAEIVGVLAIIGSLLFVGIQMRQNTSALNGNAAQNVVTNWQGPTLAMATNGALAENFAMANSPEDARIVPLDVRLQLMGLIAAIVKNCEFIYFRHLADEVDEEQWKACRRSMLASMGGPFLIDEIWPLVRLQVSDQFGDYVDELLASDEHSTASGTFAPDNF